MLDLLSIIPQDWFLDALRDRRTRLIYAGDRHEHLHWECDLQHVAGGRLTSGRGATAALALARAVSAIRPIS